VGFNANINRVVICGVFNSGFDSYVKKKKALKGS
jgi:hypothetical protein